VDGRKVLERLCNETGGRVFEVDRKNTVEAIYAQIGEELRSQYRLGFTPNDEAAKDGYHQITLTLNGDEGKKKPILETRDGYYTGVDR
jgi:VWFA-related protein